MLEVGGYLGGPYYKIIIAGTERALAATANAEVITVPAFTGAPEQLWRLDQLIDGSWRVVPRTISKNKEAMALTAKEMNSKYKETSEGGLAVSVVLC